MRVIDPGTSELVEPFAEEYARLKRDLAVRYAGDRPGYTDAKAPFIRRILDLAWAREAALAARPNRA